MNGINLKTLGLSKAAVDDSNDLTSEHGMVKEYKRLLVILKQLQILKKRTIDQIETAKRNELELLQDIGKYSNLNVSYILINVQDKNLDLTVASRYFSNKFLI